MRASQFTFATLKETPSDADIISSQLMLRAGMIRKSASGLYTWLPMGLKTLQKVKKIIREEMDAINCQELLMPVVQSAELWQESGRWEAYGPELLRFKDRHQRDFVLGPTHEEVITDIARNLLKSYKQLPVSYYQVQTKFRDEIRPRFGVMRSREFIMKDAYSFHIDQPSLQRTYDDMYRAYHNIFTRLGLDFRAVQADTGSIGGFASHEFQVLAGSGEDDIVFSDSSDYAANIELAEAVAVGERAAPTQDKADVSTPNMPTCEQVAEHLGLPLSQTVKTLIVEGEPTEEQLQRLRQGVELNDGMTLPAEARQLDEPALWPRNPPVRFRKSVPTHWLELVIREGRNRQVRRMTAAVGLPTLRLVRVRIGDWSIDGLDQGQWKAVPARL